MPANRYFIDQELKRGESISLQGQECLHLTHAMRGRLGDSVELVNGRGALARAVFTAMEKRTAYLEITEVFKGTPPSFKMVLAQAICRPSRLELVVEKGTELGLTELWLFPAQQSDQEQLTAHQQERLGSIAKAAIKQCGALFLPKITICPPLPQWKCPQDLPLFFGDLDKEAPHFWQQLESSSPKKGALFFIGSEKGFTKKEIRLLKDWGATGVSLHRNILRTETAAVAAICLMAHWAG